LAQRNAQLSEELAFGILGICGLWGLAALILSL
jgi:hypothetical protein